MLSNVVLPIFFLYFVLISGYCSSLLNCGLQRFMKNSILTSLSLPLSSKLNAFHEDSSSPYINKLDDNDKLNGINEIEDLLSESIYFKDFIKNLRKIKENGLHIYVFTAEKVPSTLIREFLQNLLFLFGLILFIVS